jgi:ubiquinone/menaquinone biosynthesis C-methylase UbiE
VAFSLPYFDDLLARLEKDPDSPVARAFRRHVHWGYYEKGRPTDDSLETYLVAAEEMTSRVVQAGRVRDGLRILDVGCGLGGTIAHLNERLSGCELVGVNIDERQIARARQTVLPRGSNTVRFVHGDACALPLDAASFDVVLAVECIFHFPSRKTFFEEARRVLRDQGTLSVSDFTVRADRLDDLEAWMKNTGASQGAFFGSNSTAISSETYARLGRSKGLDLLADVDITAETMPTYPFWKRLYGDAGLPGGVQVTAYFEEASERGFFDYRILSFEAAGAR